MNNRWIYFVMIALFVWFWFGVLAIVWTYSAPKKIDCSLSTFHPDFTTKMREQCRAVRKTT